MNDVRNEDVECIRASQLFDATWYVAKYPDVQTLGIDPVEHYLWIGAVLGRNPSPAFSTTEYLQLHADVRALGINPLLHYAKYGKSEGRLLRASTPKKSTDGLEAFTALSKVRAGTLFSSWHENLVKSGRIRYPDEQLPAVVITVVLHNSERWLTPFFNSLINSDYPLDKIELVFCDNRSTDKTPSVAKKLSERSELRGRVTLLTRENDGYGAGNDAAIAASNSEYVLVSNVDVEYHPKTIRTLVQAALGDAENVACWEPMQVPFEHPKYYDPVSLCTNWTSHACILFRRKAYEDVGGYEKALFMYGEDVELSYRLRSAGWNLRYVPFSRVTHHTMLDERTFRPVELSGSIAANILLRYRYGSAEDISTGDRLLERLLGSQSEPERHAAITQASQTVERLRSTFSARNYYGLAPFPFNDFDYDLVRAGSLHKRTEPSRIDGPLVSVITRTMKGRYWLLKEAICSVLNQTYANVQHVIVEDQSSGAEPLVSEVHRRYGANIKYCRSEKKGRTAAGNAGLSAAQGEFLLFLDDDDLLFPDHVEILVQALTRDSAAIGAYSAAWVVPTKVDRQNETYQEDLPIVIPAHGGPFDRDKLRVSNFAAIQAVLFRRVAYEKCGGFHEDLDLLEDWNLWVRYSSLGHFVFEHKLTSLYRVPADVEENVRRQRALSESYDSVRERNLKDIGEATNR